MKKTLKKAFFQLDKPFYVWALVAGPPWAQNIAFFAIWFYTVLLLAMVFINAAKSKELKALAKVPGNKEDMKEFVEKKINFLWMVPSLCVAIAAASQAWFVSAFFYASSILMSFAGAVGLKQDMKETLDEGSEV